MVATEYREPTDNCTGPKHRSRDRPKHVSPMKTRTEHGINELEITNTEFSKPNQQLVNMGKSK